MPLREWMEALRENRHSPETCARILLTRAPDKSPKELAALLRTVLQAGVLNMVELDKVRGTLGAVPAGEIRGGPSPDQELLDELRREIQELETRKAGLDEEQKRKFRLETSLEEKERERDELKRLIVELEDREAGLEEDLRSASALDERISKLEKDHVLPRPGKVPAPRRASDRPRPSRSLDSRGRKKKARETT